MKSYTATSHAIQRATERLGVTAEHAQNHLNQLMQTAYYTGETPQPSGKKAKVYDHHKSRTRLIVGNENKIVTVYKMPEAGPSLPSIFSEDIKALVQRKYNASKREHTRTVRVLEIELAELNLEMAQAQLNYAKAKSPKIRTSIGSKISEFKTKLDRIKYEINCANERFDKVKTEAEAFLCQSS